MTDKYKFGKTHVYYYPICILATTMGVLLFVPALILQKINKQFHKTCKPKIHFTRFLFLEWLFLVNILISIKVLHLLINTAQQNTHLTLGTAQRARARFASSIFLRLFIFLAGRLRRPRPSAGNANRWAVQIILL